MLLSVLKWYINSGNMETLKAKKYRENRTVNNCLEINNNF